MLESISKRNLQPNPAPGGYSLLLAILLLSVMLTMALTVAGLIIKQSQLASRSVQAMAALNAADSGLERVLYGDIKSVPVETFGSSFSSSADSTLQPFDAATYNYSVTISSGVPSTLVSTGTSGTNRRSVSITY